MKAAAEAAARAKTATEATAARKPLPWGTLMALSLAGLLIAAAGVLQLLSNEGGPPPEPKQPPSVVPTPTVGISPPATAVATPTPSRSPAVETCGLAAPPMQLPALPNELTAEDKLCVLRVWIAHGRIPEAIQQLKGWQTYAPAVLEYAKLYDPNTRVAKYSDNPAFAKSKYKKVMDMAPDSAESREAQSRLEKLRQRFPDAASPN